MPYWSGYARLERDGTVWRAIQPSGEHGSVVIEVRPETELSDAMGQWLVSCLQRGLHEHPEWLMRVWERQAGDDVPSPALEAGGVWAWHDTFAGVGFSVAVALPPGFDDAERVIRRMALSLRSSREGPQLH